MPDKFLAKALSGRVVTTVSDDGAVVRPSVAGLELAGGEPALYLPLGVRGRRGLMLLMRDRGRPGFDRQHATLATKFSLLASHAFAAKRASQTEAESNRLKHLTEQLEASQEALQHRAYIQELVAGMISDKGSGDKMAIAFIDLDNFKRVNDIYGHAAGDALLKEVADRVRSQIRPTDIFGRISGDEFVIVLDPIGRRSDASGVISRMRKCMRQPMRIDGAEIHPSGSIGVALYPEHGKDYDTLRRHADMAMYRAKTLSKGSIAFFNRELGRIATDKLMLEERLRHALETLAFRCALQQKVDIRSQVILGFEALLRWVDERGEVHSPGQFLSLASELGLLDDMTFMLLDDLLAKLPQLDAKYGTSLRYSINISPAQASKNQFMQRFVHRLQATGRASSFMLELTEETIASTISFQSYILPLLRESGIGLSIDDFGTGYSSLATLADLTADELKIDRSLIASIHERPRNQSILRAIESMGAALRLSVVAEGVETIEENLYLMAHTRLNIGQGYLFHKPELLTELIPPSKIRRSSASR